MNWEITNSFRCSRCRKTFTQRQYWFDENVFVPDSEPDVLDCKIERTKVGPVCPDCKTSTLWDIADILPQILSFPEGLLIAWKENPV